ncbi:MAG: DUF2779 domain-containing protein [Candidatus Pacearchaeota archaeon]
MPILTKSKYVDGLKCLKYLWLQYNNPSAIPAPDEYALFVINEGHKVGEFAKTLYPDGIAVSTESNDENIRKTQQLLKLRKPLFEAGISIDNCYARTDILLPVEKDEWDIVEVKSSSRVKEDEHIPDVAFQKYVYSKAGLKIRKCIIMHVDSKYERNGNIDAEALFVREDVTEKVGKVIKEVPKNIRRFFTVIKSKKCPEIDIGNYCADEFGVHENDAFWKKHPDCNILQLYHSKDKEELFNKGILRIKDIPSSYRLDAKQLIQKKCDENNSIHINKKEISNFLSNLQYPLHFLDFETYNTAIPLYDKLKPWEKVAFQYSLHIVKDENAKPLHYSFLAKNNSDPRKDFIESLEKKIMKKGSIVVWNAVFEKSILKSIAEHMPEYAVSVNEIIGRIEDLMIPFKDFSYYNPKQKGSNSLKTIFPLLTGRSYQGLNISEGGIASARYYKAVHESIKESEKEKIFDDLEKYCSLDTEAMIFVLDKLNEIAK